MASNHESLVDFLSISTPMIESPTKPNKTTELHHVAGKKRVIIEHISPAVEGGLYPAKRVVGEKVEVEADVFSDGHDVVKAVLLYKFASDKHMKQIPMEFAGNDHWKASFIPDKKGFYEYTVLGYVDHFITWRDGLKKKFEANQNVSVELLIGAEMLENTAQHAQGEDAHLLREWARKLREDHEHSMASGVTLALEKEVSRVMYDNYDRSNATTYPNVYKVEVERKKALYSTWYELFPRSTSPEPGRHGTFRDTIRLLPHIKEMGFDVLYLPPIHPIGRTFRKGLNNALTANPGDPGSPWAIGSEEGGHKAIHRELGTLKDFQDLIWIAGEQGIEIAMDIAYQCSPDHPYVKEHPQWFKWRPDGTVQYAENPPKKYQDILPINFETEDWENLWKELKSVLDYWVEKGIRIFRVDNPHTKAFGFWEWAIGEVRKNEPDVIFLAEAFTRPRIMERLAKIGFNQSYTYFTWRNNPWELKQYMLELTKSPMRDYYRPNFWPNTPDILPPVLTHGGEAAYIMRLVLAATLSSNYGLYGPVYEYNINTPYPGKEENLDSEKYEIKHWDWDKETRTKEILIMINQIRKENPALHNTWNLHFADVENPQMIVYGKNDEASGNIILVAVNMDPYHTQGSWVRLPLKELGIDSYRSYVAYDMLSKSRYTWYGEWNYIELNPYQIPAHVFRIEQ